MPPMPPITQALLLINVAAFCIDIFLGPWFTRLLALWPLGYGFLPWQVVTYAFLHGSIGHLFFNMLALWMFGPDIERVWGTKRFVQFYGVSLLAAAVAQLLVAAFLNSSDPTIGASGAIYGLLLAYALTFPRRQFDLVGFLPMLLLTVPSQTLNTVGVVFYFILLLNRQAVPIPPVCVPAQVTVALFGAVELFQGVYFHTGVAHFAHLGGMLGGYLMFRYWRGQPPFKRRH